MTTFTGILAGEVMGIMFDSSDTLFATTHVTNSPLYTLDVVTGAASIVGTTMFHKPHGGDIYVIPAPVPEPSTLLLVALGLVGGIRYFPRARSA
ncbi:MAG: PEP-CTERM sorting domain-containing protein [Myxococcales bacterium]|nr:PEP-CTERM sorting domain-containing protein [Myxococcales bacterium]